MAGAFRGGWSIRVVGVGAALIEMNGVRSAGVVVAGRPQESGGFVEEHSRSWGNRAAPDPVFDFLTVRTVPSLTLVSAVFLIPW